MLVKKIVCAQKYVRMHLFLSFNNNCKLLLQSFKDVYSLLKLGNSNINSKVGIPTEVFQVFHSQPIGDTVFLVKMVVTWLSSENHLLLLFWIPRLF